MTHEDKICISCKSVPPKVSMMTWHHFDLNDNCVEGKYTFHCDNCGYHWVVMMTKEEIAGIKRGRNPVGEDISKDPAAMINSLQD